MDSAQKQQIEEIIDSLECPKDFICYKSKFENLCKARDIGLEAYLECKENDLQACKFSLPFGYSSLCRCPLRLYIAKRLKK